MLNLLSIVYSVRPRSHQLYPGQFMIRLIGLLAEPPYSDILTAY